VPLSFAHLKSSTFRLSAIYLFLFALSVGAILAYVYWSTAGLLERQSDETIRADVQALADQYRFRGLVGIVDTIRRRVKDEDESTYLLVNPDGNTIAGNLDAWPPEARDDRGWIDFITKAKTKTGDELHSSRAYYTELPNGYHLLAGRDINAIRQLGEIFQRTILGAIGITLALGLGGGLWMSRNFLRRVDSITDASRSIMAGDLSGRMPVSGTGDELDRLANALNEMLGQIERLMAAMKEVSSNIAHDLRSPLSRLKLRVESALRSEDCSQYRDALVSTIEESDRLIQTFNALLSIARAEAGQTREGLDRVDAAGLLEDVAELYRPIVEDEGGSLETRIDPDLIVRADRQLLAQAISNLVDNAAKHGVVDGAEGANIVLSGKKNEGGVVISIEDRGPGIPVDQRERVVERFVRLDQSRSMPGNGLGLSLVGGVMTLHGGHLVFEDNNPGLRVKLVLPPYNGER
jgi:signal transduction histidine kinase